MDRFAMLGPAPDVASTPAQAQEQARLAPTGGRAAEAGPGRARRWWCRHGPDVAIVLAVFLTFAPALSFDILRAWDDQVYILNNEEALAFSLANAWRWVREPFFANYHPLTMWSYMLDHGLWGMWGPGYHLQNLAWHAAAALAVHRLATLVGLSVPAALFCTLFWTVHPLRVESVVWLSERKDVICAAFYGWGLCAAARDLPQRRFSLGALVCFVLAFLAKSMAVSFPFVLLCLAWHSQRRGDWRRWLAHAAPYAVLLLMMVPVTFVVQQAEHGVRHDWELGRQVLVTWANLFRYLEKTVLPVGLNPIYPLTDVGMALVWYALLLSLATGAALAGLWLCARPWLLFVLLPAACAYGLMLGPVSGIVPLGSIDFADRYSYLPSLPIALVLGSLLDWWLRRGVVPLRPRLVAAGICLVLAAASSRVCWVWRDMSAVFGTACRVARPNMVAVGAWGDCLINEARYPEALALAESGLARVPGSPKMRYLKARSLDKLGRKTEALAMYEELLSVLPSVGLFAGMADCCRDLGQFSRAEALYSRVVQEEPRNYDARLNRGVVRFNQGRHQLAALDFRAAADLAPDRPEPLLNLAKVLHAAGHQEQALRVLRSTLRRYPQARKMLK